MSKYYISYSYDRSKKETVNNKEVLKTFKTTSSDVFTIDYPLKDINDIYLLEKFIFNKLKPLVVDREQELVALLILGIYKLEE